MLTYTAQHNLDAYERYKVVRSEKAESISGVLFSKWIVCIKKEDSPFLFFIYSLFAKIHVLNTAPQSIKNTFKKMLSSTSNLEAIAKRTLKLKQDQANSATEPQNFKSFLEVINRNLNNLNNLKNISEQDQLYVHENESLKKQLSAFTEVAAEETTELTKKINRLNVRHTNLRTKYKQLTTEKKALEETITELKKNLQDQQALEDRIAELENKLEGQKASLKKRVSFKNEIESVQGQQEDEIGLIQGPESESLFDVQGLDDKLAALDNN